MSSQKTEFEVSIVMPCLNEADTIETCITKAQKALRDNRISGEIVLADNGSDDDSIQIAERCGARVIKVREKGYGNALMGGIGAARGNLIIMGDADDSYDFLDVPKFVDKLRDGYDLVMGCRFAAGGGRVMPSAMPFLHRWWGNPMFSWLARVWFRSPFNDVHCGMRGFNKDFYRRIEARCTGMEFATEMTIKASLNDFRLAEVPITLYPDGRRSHPPHLKTFRDGWRHLRLYLIYTPRWLFLIPGVFFVLLGLAGYIVALPKMRVAGVTFDVHTLLFASLFILCGYQSISFAFLTKIFAIMEGLLPQDPRLDRLFEVVDLEKGLIVSAIALVVGLSLLLVAVNEWRLAGFGDLNYAETMRWVIPGATITSLAVQTVFLSFFASILGIKRR